MQYQVDREGRDWRIVAEVSEDPAESVVTRRITAQRQRSGEWRSTTEIHRVATFTDVELEHLLEEVGFSVHVVRSYGAVDLPPRRLGAVAQKPRVLNE
jgi:hypothetical protein